MYKYAIIRNGSLSSYRIIDELSEITVPVIPIKVTVKGTTPKVVTNDVGETIEFVDGDVEKNGYIADRIAKVELFNYDDGSTKILSFADIEKLSGVKIQSLEEQFPNGFSRMEQTL